MSLSLCSLGVASASVNAIARRSLFPLSLSSASVARSAPEQRRTNADRHSPIGASRAKGEGQAGRLTKLNSTCACQRRRTLTLTDETQSIPPDPLRSTALPAAAPHVHSFVQQTHSKHAQCHTPGPTTLRTRQIEWRLHVQVPGQWRIQSSDIATAETGRTNERWQRCSDDRWRAIASHVHPDGGPCECSCCTPFAGFHLAAGNVTAFAADELVCDSDSVLVRCGRCTIRTAESTQRNRIVAKLWRACRLTADHACDPTAAAVTACASSLRCIDRCASRGCGATQVRFP